MTSLFERACRAKCPVLSREVIGRLATAVAVGFLIIWATPGVTARSVDVEPVRADTAPWMLGVNLAAGEFNPTGRELELDYTYPSVEEMDYYVAKQIRIFRIPFLAERIIRPTLTMGPRLTSDMDILVELIEHAAKREAYVILDMHDYGKIFTAGLIGRAPGSVEEFAAAWRLIAERVRDHPNVIFGLMNEPHRQSAREWLLGANAAIAAIREEGAGQMILVPGSYWSGAHSWTSSDNAVVMVGVVDPGDNFAFEVHQYFDGNNSGTTEEAVQGAGSTRLAGFTEWARQHGYRGFLGEFGWADSPEAHAEGEALLAHMSENRDVWIGGTYWAGGPWWGDYSLAITPKEGEDRPQMKVLERFVD